MGSSSQCESFWNGILVFKTGFNQLSGNVFGDLERFSDGSTLGDKALEHATSRKIRASLNAFNGDWDKIF